MWIINRPCGSATWPRGVLPDRATLVSKWIPITLTHDEQELHDCLHPILPGTRGGLHQLLLPEGLVWSEGLFCASLEPNIFQALSQAIIIDEAHIAGRPPSLRWRKIMCLTVSLSQSSRESVGEEEEEKGRHFSRELYSQTQPGIPHQWHHI